MRTYKQNLPKLFLYCSSRGDFRGNFAFTSANRDGGRSIPTAKAIQKKAVKGMTPSRKSNATTANLAQKKGMFHGCDNEEIY